MLFFLAEKYSEALKSLRKVIAGDQRERPAYFLLAKFRTCEPSRLGERSV